MHHPALAGPFLAYNNVLLQTPTLGHRLRELMILRVAWRTARRYEWAQHVRLAARVGITAEEIAAIGDGPDADRWTPLEADLLAATDQLIDRYRVDDDTWDAARRAARRRTARRARVRRRHVHRARRWRSTASGLQLDADLQAIATTSFPEIEE